MKKKLVSALTVTLAVSCVLYGCGGGKDSGKTGMVRQNFVLPHGMLREM